VAWQQDNFVNNMPRCVPPDARLGETNDSGIAIQSKHKMKTKHTKQTTTPPMAESTPTGISASVSPPDQAPHTLPDSIVVFNLRENWRQVKPHLAKVKPVLTTCMNAYLVESGDEDPLYDLKGAPWKTSTNLKHWLHIQIMKAAERGEFIWERPRHDATQQVVAKTWEEYRTYAERFSPKPDTFDWYYTETAEYYMAPWLIALGQNMFPEFIWTAFYTHEFAFAGGIDMQSKLRVIFDMRSSKSPNPTEMLRCLYDAQENQDYGEKGPLPAFKTATPRRPTTKLQDEPGPTQHGDTHPDNMIQDATLVKYNGLLMPESERKRIMAAQTQQAFTRRGVRRERIRYGEEITSWQASKYPCHDCRAVKGQLHVFGCDVEECPFCGRQAFICGCKLKIA